MQQRNAGTRRGAGPGMLNKSPERGSSRSAPKTRNIETPLIEWLLGAIGALFLISSVGFLIHQGLQGADRPGVVELRAGEISQVGTLHLVRFTASNQGTLSLAGLHLSAHLYRGDEEVDSASTVLDHLPAQSSREGGFFLRENPRQYRLELRVEGYQNP